MNVNSVLKKVLKDISVSRDEEAGLKKIAIGVVKKIPGAQIGGSLAKATLIKKDVQDIDIFVVFNSEEETKKLGEILRKKGFSGRVLHGSRDYFQIKRGKVLLEIIPVVKVRKKENVENITDFSLSHVSYVKKKLCSRFSFDDNKNPPTHPKLVKRKSPGRSDKSSCFLADEIKLAKVFCFAADCYGAESYISGFSGYALELLVIYFGGFVKFLKGIQKKGFVDIEKDFKSEREALQEINASKLQAPVLLVDPTYKYRNVCAGLSRETFEKFLGIAKKFLKKPSKSFFEKKEFNLDSFKKRTQKGAHPTRAQVSGNNKKLSQPKRSPTLIKLVLKTNRQEGDIAGTKMKKFFNFLISELKRKRQEVVASHFEYSGEGQSAEGYLGVRESKVMEVEGPPVLDKKSVVGFRKSRGKIFKKKGHYWAKESVSVEKVFKRALRVAGEMGISDFSWKF